MSNHESRARMKTLHVRRNQNIAGIQDLNHRLFASPSQAGDNLRALRELRLKRDRAVRNYVDQLPRLVVGRCPYCDQLSSRVVDVFGLDGLWWDVQGPDSPPEACEHYLVTSGALNFCGQNKEQVIRSCSGQIEPGPEVPFILPRLMNLPNVICIISSYQIEELQFLLFFMSYYANPPLKPEVSISPWPRNSLYFQGTDPDQQRALFWSSKTEVKDFDIAKWLSGSERKVGWISPDDPKRNVLFQQSRNCPFVDVPGNRADTSIRDGKVTVFDPSDEK